MMLAPMGEGGPSLDQDDSDWFPVHPMRDPTRNQCFELDAGLLGGGPASCALWKTLLVQPLGWYLQSYMAQGAKQLTDGGWRGDSAQVPTCHLSHRISPGSAGAAAEISSLHLRNSRLFE